MKTPFLPSPRDEYDKLNKEIASLEKYLAPVNEARLERQFALDKARAGFIASPSGDTLDAWLLARERAVGQKNSDSFGSTFSHLETIRGDVEHEVNTWRQSLKSSPKAMQIYMRCLQEIAANIRKAIASKREEIGEKLRGVGAAVDIEQVAPLPLWTDRANHLDNLASKIEAKLAMPSILSSPNLVDEARAQIESQPLTDPAPAPQPAPRPQQGYPPGWTREMAGLPPEAPAPPPPSLTVPVNTINIDQIKAEMDRVANEREEQCRAQAAEIAAANRAKEAQAVGA